MKGFPSMIYLPLTNRPSPPDLDPVRSAIQDALNDANESERPGLRRALDIVDEFVSADRSPATEEWARKTLAVAGVDPKAKEIQGREVERAQVVPVVLVAGDALVVVDEVAAPVEDELPRVHLQGARMVRGVAVDEVHAGVDQGVRTGGLGAGDEVAPVGAPVD